MKKILQIFAQILILNISLSAFATDNNYYLPACSRNDKFTQNEYDSNNLQIITNIARMYTEMYLKNPDNREALAKAFEWNLKAFQLNDVNAINNIGKLYIDQMMLDEYIDAGKNVDLAIEWYTKAANLGNVQAFYELANRYNLKVRNIDGDENIIRLWHKYLYKALEGGHLQAFTDMGLYYDLGSHGFKQDYNKAMMWYLKAAEKGNLQAMILIAKLYGRGCGVPQNYEKAREWHFKAAENGGDRTFTHPNVKFLDFELAKSTIDDFKKKFSNYKKLSEDNEFNGGSTFIVKKEDIKLEGIYGDVVFIFNKQNLLEAVLVHYVKAEFDKIKKDLDNQYHKWNYASYQSGNSIIILENFWSTFRSKDLKLKEGLDDFITLKYTTFPFESLVVEKNVDLEQKQKNMQRDKRLEIKVRNTVGNVEKIYDHFLRSSLVKFGS